MERTGKRYRDYLMALLMSGALVFASACSVKEDRTPCPCILDMDFICPDEADADHVGLVVESSDEILWRDTVDVMRNGQGYQVPVPASMSGRGQETMAGRLTSVSSSLWDKIAPGCICMILMCVQTANIFMRMLC